MKENYTNSFGKTLKALRKKSGLTQEELASIVGVHETSIRRWESGGRLPNAEYVKKLAEALHVNEQQLFNDEASVASGWVLTIKVADSFMEEVIDLAKGIIPSATITLADEGASMTITGTYELWKDIKNVNNLVAQIFDQREAIVLSGVKRGKIKPDMI